MFRHTRDAGGSVFESDGRLLRISFISPSIARVTYTEGRPFTVAVSRIIAGPQSCIQHTVQEDGDVCLLSTERLTIRLNRRTGALAYFDATDRLLVKEPDRGGRWLTSKALTRNIFDHGTTIAAGESVDGARATATSYKAVFDGNVFEAKLEFEFSVDEALFGLGSHEEGYGNLRGRSRELYQQNMKAVVPHLVSTRGYSILLDCCSLMTFHDDALGSYWWADAVDQLDFYLIHGDTFDEIMASYYLLTGPAPMLPKWAFGYVQSKERYVTAREMIQVVKEYRRRKVPLDAIVLDWKSWPNGNGWGQKSLDPARFPDPSGLVEKLHELGARLMVSIWPIVTGGCENQLELLNRGLMLGNQSTYNAFLPEARACYWQQAQRGLFSFGVDAWWCDCAEPFEADWTGRVKPESHVRLAMNTEASKLYITAGETNAYSLAHSQGIYEGQRSASVGEGPVKRVMNLTRSSYAGQHRYATVTWNGDISATWEALRRCIPEGLNFCATGEPYWTVDAGGFFIDYRDDLWFWRGDYHAGCRGLTIMDAIEPDASDTGCSDLGYWELYTRWIQYAAFLPMFRSHGTDAPREIWRFGDEGSMFYDAIAEAIRSRYRLVPYVYSLAAAVTFHGIPIMRALALEFPRDLVTHNIADQYLFGPALLVCPVTMPMYYGRESVPIHDVPKSRRVYLPSGSRWFDFWTGEVHAGGQTVTVDAPITRIPLFVRAGSIIPMTEVMQFTDQDPGAAYELHVYPGGDAQFTLYEDVGDGYDYEHGEFATIQIEWSEDGGELIIHDREGSFPCMTVKREFRIRFFGEAAADARRVIYAGTQIRVQR